jgi:hypothetical protein
MGWRIPLPHVQGGGLGRGGGLPTAMAVIDLASGQMLWTYTGPGMFGTALAQPGGRDFAI